MSAWLDRFDLFAALSADERAGLATRMTVASHPPGAELVREGDPTPDDEDTLYLVLDGAVEVTVSAPKGGYGVRRTMGPGALFGLVSLIDGAPRSTTCRAVGPVRVATLSRAALAAIRDDDVALWARLRMCMARKLAADLRRLSDDLADAVQGREEALMDRFDAVE